VSLKRTTLVALVMAAGLALSGCKSAVLHGLSEQESNHIVAVLQEQGIMATKEADDSEAGTWTIVVARRDVPKVWSILQQYRLPSSPGRRFQDVFGKSKLVVAPIEEKALFLEALQGELSHTLESITGVVSARVHVAVPETDLSGQATSKPKASVMLEYHPDASGAAPVREDEVRRLVASGVTDLDPQDVAVVMRPILIQRSQQAYDFVAFGPLVVAATSVGTLKILTVGMVLLVVVLGAILYLNGRVMSDLRQELQAAQRQARALQRPAKPSS
jgi:type III secretion protein J